MGFDVPKTSREADSDPCCALGSTCRSCSPRGWWRWGGTSLCLCCVPWEIEPSSQSPLQSSSLPPLFPDQEELDEAINNLRKELRVKVNQLYEAQGKPELKGFNLNPMSAEEMKLINRILEG
uniref:P53 and DNA damage regulated 1 n=1 Tax=Cyanistes caeruleus TaxID=156563 RepID=A0A8C0Z7T7_CYACU